MKLILAVLSLFAVTCQAQTFVRYTLNQFTNGEASMSFEVPTNTVFKGVIMNGGSSNGQIEVLYPESATPLRAVAIRPFDNDVATPVLGPAIIHFFGNGATNAILVLIAEFTPVNTTPAIQGFGVQPANSSAQIGLETSTDLKTWQTTTNGSYGLTNSARFFRMNLTVTP